MDSTTLAVYTPSSNSAPCMVLPEHVDGYIDLPTLADIHRFLSQSSLEEDQMLATWVKESYLYEPSTVAGREIRTTEGFSKLDHAYRRVRSLTNKAQDKWPFFDRNWKHMSSTTVRNNARGESAPGISLPGMDGVAHDAVVTNGQHAPQVEASLTPSSFIPFGAKQPVRYQQKSQHRQRSFSHSMPHTPVSLSPTKQLKLDSPPISEKLCVTQEELGPEEQALRDLSPTEDLSPLPECLARTRSESAQELEFEGVNTKSEELIEKRISYTETSDGLQSVVVALSTADNEVERNAGGGKVRGPNGRYLPKTDTTPRSSKLRRSTGSTRAKAGASKNAATPLQQAQATSPAPLGGESPIMVDAPSAPATTQQSELEKQHGSDGGTVSAAEESTSAPAVTSASKMDKPSARVLTEPPSSEPSNDIATNDSNPADATPAYLTLAAEAEAVSSNLDKLPPSSLRNNKRKSEATPCQVPPRKRGRPRKADIEKYAENATAKKADRSTTETISTASEGQSVVEEEEVPRMVTRRTTRLSAAADLDLLTPAKPDITRPMSEKLQEQVEEKEEEMIDVDEQAPAGHETHPPAPAASKVHPVPAQPKPQSVPATPSQLVASASKGASRDESVDSLTLGLRKTGSFTKRTKPKKRLEKVPARETGTSQKGTSKVLRGLDDEPIPSATKEPTSASLLQAQLVNGSTLNDIMTVKSSDKVEYIARVHTSAGIVDISMTRENIIEEAEVVQRYAEWMKNQGAAHVPFETFKSIFSIAKNG